MNKYIETVTLPELFQPKLCKDLIRVGSNSDGGYLVSKNDVLNSNFLVSLGLGLDWSFEKEFRKLNNNALIHSYDGSTGFKYLRKNSKLRLKRFLLDPNISNFYNFFDRFIKLIDLSIFYKFNFLSNRIKHFESFVEFRPEEKPNFREMFGYQISTISFDELISKYHKNVYLSIDIEGGEYKILEKIIKNTDKISGLSIEFHFVNENLDTIQNFIEKINMNLIHLHINNFGPIINGIPQTIELSFTCSDVNNFTEPVTLPNKLDKKNDSEGYDYKLTFN